MTYEVWTIDGTDISNLVRDIKSFDGLDDTPELIGDDTVLPQMHGYIPGEKFYGGAEKSVSMVVIGADPNTGIIPASLDTSRNFFDSNLDTLVRLLYRPRRLIDVRRQMNTLTKQAMCEVVSPIQPTELGLTSAELNFVLKIPSGFWQDVNVVNSAQYAPGSNISIVEFAAATAPMDDLVWTITGPATNPRVTDVESGCWFQYTGTVGAGTTLILDSGAMTAAGTSSPNIQNMSHDGCAKWLELNSSIAGCLINFTATGTTAATKVQVSGRRKWLR